jgi:hypothetical protein
LVFSDLPAFLTMLQKSGLFPQDFIDSLFYRRGKGQPSFAPYLAFVRDENDTGYQIISDSANGESEYFYMGRLYPDFLKMGMKGFDVDGEQLVGASDPSTDHIQRIYRRFVPNTKIFEEYIPRPAFFRDVLYPSLAENMVIEWIKDVIFESKNWGEIKTVFGFQPLTNFRKYHRLFERFDLYITRGNTLYCIDVKAWSEASGYRLSQKTIDKSIRKLENIQSDYPEFTTVRGLLLNLHMPAEKFQQITPNLASGSLFYLDANQHPVESHTLRDFLIQKGNNHAAKR